MMEIFGSQPIINNSHSLNLSDRQIQCLPMGSFSTKEDSSPAASISSPTPTTSASAMGNALECPTVSPAATSKRMGPRQKYWQMREERAAGKYQLLKEYTASKLKKMDEAEKGKEARLVRKEKLLRELFNKP
ncbi:uncharacterized protein LOC129941518 [Eupeodes corollae]|uniref:uncharacterized protein LOC129941518 n=1 Tax=Eupeodes corollae TaxID=290404 RepID=UPI002492703B|nr:uncharacterized protein LOC129941518 [Eupeodes corollae]